tara:strand:+ start:666 stop:896 length:231 start_codon:yes stop_codon:yes gene_type:complete
MFYLLSGQVPCLPGRFSGDSFSKGPFVILGPRPFPRREMSLEFIFVLIYIVSIVAGFGFLVWVFLQHDEVTFRKHH